jgi:hypothetical protein
MALSHFMHAAHLIPLIVSAYPELSPASKLRLESELKNLLKADRRDKLDEFQAMFADMEAPQRWRSLADVILMSHSDLELGLSCPWPHSIYYPKTGNLNPDVIGQACESMVERCGDLQGQEMCHNSADLSVCRGLQAERGGCDRHSSST